MNAPNTERREIDLTPPEDAQRARLRARVGWWVAVLAASLVSLVLLGGALSRRAAQLEVLAAPLRERVESMREDTETLRALTLDLDALRAETMERAEGLDRRAQGLDQPDWAGLLGDLADACDDRAELSALEILPAQQGRALRLQGRARSHEAALQMLRRLDDSPHIVAVRLGACSALPRPDGPLSVEFSAEGTVR